MMLNPDPKMHRILRSGWQVVAPQIVNVKNKMQTNIFVEGTDEKLRFPVSCGLRLPTVPP